MAFGVCNQTSICLDDILKYKSEVDILNHYLGISTLPVLINSPLRKDNNSSLSIFVNANGNVIFKDFGLNKSYNLWSFLKELWKCSYSEMLIKLHNDINTITKSSIKVQRVKKNQSISNIQVKCKIREWKEHDIDYWNSYGITLEWLKYAEVYPILYTIIVKNGEVYNIRADKYAYAYVEHKDGNTTLKIYQPFNTRGFKWTNNHNKSVISLWTKVPKKGDTICICSSLKDALCMWINVGIPSIAVQGEGYLMSKGAIENLKSRYKTIYILFDNDAPGLINGERLAKETGFINKVLPNIGNQKDVSDLYKHLNNKEQFKQIILTTLKN